MSVSLFLSGVVGVVAVCVRGCCCVYLLMLVVADGVGWYADVAVYVLVGIVVGRVAVCGRRCSCLCLLLMLAAVVC